MGMFSEEDYKRKMVDLALNACKKRYSQQTEFIHFFAGDPLSVRQDTIPSLENFLYAYTLFRSKLVDNIQQAKSLIERLLSFEVEGNFPYYLHEYPNRVDPCHSSQFLAPIFYILRDFSSVLGEELEQKLKCLANRIVNHLSALQITKSISSVAENRLLAFLGQFDPDLWNPKTPSEWADFCICSQMAGKPLTKALAVWDPIHSVYVGGCLERLQESLEPAVTLFDLFMGEVYRSFSSRALQSDLVHLKAGLIQSMDCLPMIERKKTSFTVLVEENKRQRLTFYFGSSLETHSLTLEAKTGSFSITQKDVQRFVIEYTYEESIPSEEDSVELAFYLSAHPSQEIYVNDAKATVFKSGESIFLKSPFLHVFLSFFMDQKDGQCLGHISKGNRSYQKSQKIYAAYDWKIGWRTLRRNPKATTQLEIFCE